MSELNNQIEAGFSEADSEKTDFLTSQVAYQLTDAIKTAPHRAPLCPAYFKKV